MRLLVTGFEPFAGSAANPSERLIGELAAREHPGIDLETAVLPVDRLRGPEKLIRLVEESRPDAILCLGEASNRPVISIERLAVNLLSFSIPDNQGVLVEDEPIIAGGPAAYFVTLPVQKAYEAIRAAQVPVEHSLSAGSYLCNQVLYTLLHHLARQGREVPAGFIHLPPLPEQAAAQKKPSSSMSLETSLRGVSAVIDMLRKTSVEADQPARQALEPALPANLTIRRATAEDIETLTSMRQALQQEIGNYYADPPVEGALEATRRFLSWALPSGEFLAWLVEADGRAVACGGLALYHRMPGMHALASCEGYIMDMYTQPAYRHQGLASALLGQMVQFAKNAGARRVWLRATDMGKPVYEKFGFQSMEYAMQFKIE